MFVTWCNVVGWVLFCGGSVLDAEDAVQLLLEKRPSLRPWRNRPYVLEALWKREGLRTEWHMELSAVDGN